MRGYPRMGAKAFSRRLRRLTFREPASQDRPRATSPDAGRERPRRRNDSDRRYWLASHRTRTAALVIRSRRTAGGSSDGRLVRRRAYHISPKVWRAFNPSLSRLLSRMGSLLLANRQGRAAHFFPESRSNGTERGSSRNATPRLFPTSRVCGWVMPVFYRFAGCLSIMHHYFGIRASWRPPDGERTPDRDPQHGIFPA